MYNEKISTIVYKEIDDFKNKKITVDKSSFNQYDNIKRINLYIHDTFLERQEGIFWNLSTPRIPHFAKNIDLDTKDFYPYGEGEVSMVQSWILRMKFYAWARRNGLALLLNELSEGLATYGSMVWKKVKGENGTELEECNLENIYFNQTVKNIKDANIVELHYLSETELREKEDIWDNVSEIIKKGKNENKDEIIDYEIWERWGEFEVDDDIKYMHYIGHGEGDEELICYEEETKKKKCPYYDFHISRYSGRWQRIGVVERLYKLQERANQLVNQNAQVSEIASLLLLRSQEQGLSGVNVLEQVENGLIVNSGDLQQIVLQNPGISQFVSEMQMIEAHADKLCMTPAVMTGGKLPSGTPFRGMALMSNAAKSTFDYIKQSIGQKIVDILLDEILPEEVKKWNKGELLEIAGDEQDVEIYDESIKRKMKMESLLNFQVVDPVREQLIELKAENELPQVGRKMKIPENYIDFEYNIRINPTGESFDLAKQNDANSNAITWAMQNPGVIDLPMFRQYLENNGLRWQKLKPKQLEAIKQGTQPGGQPGGQPQGVDAISQQADVLAEQGVPQ